VTRTWQRTEKRGRPDRLPYSIRLLRPRDQRARRRGRAGRQPSRTGATPVPVARRVRFDRPDKRREFFYWTDDGDLAGLRYEQWKAVFMEQQAHGLDVWMQPMVPLRLPRLFDLRSDPFERAQQESGDYVRWFIDHAFVLVPAQAIVGQFLTSFQQFSPRQRPGSFTVEQAMEKLRNPPSSN